MACVVDASVAVVWFLPDEVSSIADIVLKRVHAEGAYVPDLFWHEIRNVLLNAYRRKRLERNELNESAIRAQQLPLVTTKIGDTIQVLTLAERHGLTAYDAAYLALAMELALPLATLDKQLITAASREGVPLLT